MAIIDQTALADQTAQRLKQELPQRGGTRILSGALSFLAIGLGSLPIVGMLAGVPSHLATRLRTSTDAKHELKVRAKYYSSQISQILGIEKERVGVDEFRMAAQASPHMRKLYNEVLEKKSTENKIDGVASVGIGIAGSIGMGGAAHGVKLFAEGAKTAAKAAQSGRQMVGQIAGGAVGGVLFKNSYSAQELVEATHKALIDAQAQGIARTQVVNPQTIFLIRAAQDEHFLNELNFRTKKEFNKPLHQLTAEQLNQVMAGHPQLSAAVTREAHAVANGDMSIQDVGASAPNLKAGHTHRLSAAADYTPREAVNDASYAPREAANDSSWSTRIQQQRMQQIGQKAV